MTSTETAAKASPRTTAQSSPIQRTTRVSRGRASTASMAAISSRSPMELHPGGTGRAGRSPLAVAVDDPSAVEIVRRDFDPVPFPRQDPYQEAPPPALAVYAALVAVVLMH